jgi:hypothetical protein
MRNANPCSRYRTPLSLQWALHQNSTLDTSRQHSAQSREWVLFPLNSHTDAVDQCADILVFRSGAPALVLQQHITIDRWHLGRIYFGEPRDRAFSWRGWDKGEELF